MPRAVLPLLIVLEAISICVAGCTDRQSPVLQDSAVGGTTAGTISYLDGIGRQVNLPRHPRRIISLAPNVTETIYLLGANDRLIGVTVQCDWPADAVNKPKIGDLLNPNYELILAARPDLVIASTAGNDRAAVLKLSDLGLPVFVTAPRSTEKIMESIAPNVRPNSCPR
jgi:ABC-type Fe3+-hydroxamate transport system substrate-binding protein